VEEKWWTKLWAWLGRAGVFLSLAMKGFLFGSQRGVEMMQVLKGKKNPLSQWEDLTSV